jgi:Fur family peroxide stress response transcriptional regulator
VPTAQFGGDTPEAKIYEALVSRPGHYSPEEIYEQVKQDLPSISLATVYKNLNVWHILRRGQARDLRPEPGQLPSPLKSPPCPQINK